MVKILKAKKMAWDAQFEFFVKIPANLWGWRSPRFNVMSLVCLQTYFKFQIHCFCSLDIYSVSNYIFWFQFGPIKRKCTKQISRIWIHCNTSFRGATPTVASLKPLNISLIQADVRPYKERKKDVLYILHHEFDFQYN